MCASSESAIRQWLSYRIPGTFPARRLLGIPFVNLWGTPWEIGPVRGRNRRFWALPCAADQLIRPRSAYTPHHQLLFPLVGYYYN